eukprot:765898-Hanusia_phi.AAC.1
MASQTSSDVPHVTWAEAALQVLIDRRQTPCGWRRNMEASARTRPTSRDKVGRGKWEAICLGKGIPEHHSRTAHSIQGQSTAACAKLCDCCSRTQAASSGR